MRNDVTDRLGRELTVAWINSNMTVSEFIRYCDDNRPAVLSTTGDTMHVVVNATVITCYFTENRWWCKA